MTDKQAGSSHPSARPPLPSIAPPTDDIDSEWGADEIPAAAKVPQFAAVAAAPSQPPAASPSQPPAASPSQPPAASPSYPPAPEPTALRPSAPAAAAPAATAAKHPAASNPLRKQTLLGMAPVISPRSEPPAAAVWAPRSEPTRPSSMQSEPPRPSQPATPAAADNPLRKQTLFGIAPAFAARSEPPAAVAQESSPPAAAAAEPAAKASAEHAISVAALEAAPATAAEALASDAPSTRDVASKSARLAARVAASPVDTDDLPELRARRPRWLLPLAAAAVIGLGVVGLRTLDSPPIPLEPVAVTPRPGAKAATTAVVANADDNGDADSHPDATTPTEPEPLKAGSAAAAAPAPSAPALPSRPAAAATPAPAADSAAASPAPSTAAAEPEVAFGESKSINVTSDPPSARMFWKGKEVGTTPFVLKVPAGQRRSYELGLPGFVTRKVVIDGTKSDISIGLKPEL